MKKIFLPCLLTASYLISCTGTELARIEYKGDKFYGFETSEPNITYPEATESYLEPDDAIITQDIRSRELPPSITVQPGDTVASIAKNYNIEEQTIIAENNIKKPDNLKVGQVIAMPNVVFHEVQQGETISSIAKKYNQDTEKIALANDLEKPYELYSGQIIKIGTQDKIANEVPRKNYSKAVATNDAKGSEVVLTSSSPFIMPVAGKIISKFGDVNVGVRNDGINFSAPLGSTVKAVEAGEIVYAGNDLKGYGNLVIINHEDGLMTAYGHLENLKFKKGAFVHKGQIIGHVGKSGSTRKPLLHFAVRKDKKPVNPEQYLPKIY